MAVGVAAVGVLISSALVSGASVAPKLHKSTTSTTVKPDFKFFRGKTINIIVSGAPGGGGSNFVVDQSQALGAYLHATVNVSYVPGANVVEEDIVGASKPDGLTLGVQLVSTQLNSVYTNVGTTNYPLLKTSYVVGILAAPEVIVSCLNSPFTSASSIIHATTPVTDVNPPGASNLVIRLFLAGYSVPRKYLTGYSGFADQLVGCERGDGQLSQNLIANEANSAGTAMSSGLKPLLIVSTGKIPLQFPQSFMNRFAPTLATFAKQNPPKTALGREAIKIELALFNAKTPGSTLFGPPGIPKARLLALIDASTAALHQASVKQKLTANGLTTSLISGPAVLNYIKFAIKKQPLIQGFLAR